MTDIAPPEEGLMLYNSGRVLEHKRGQAILSAIQQTKLGALPREAVRTVKVARVQGIPPLSWAARVDANECRLKIGSLVEQTDRGIVEGVWDGPFEKGEFQTSGLLFGSGVSWRGKLVFTPPKHCWEYLYVLADKEAGSCFVSNSLNFVLSEAEIDLCGDFFRLVEENIFSSTNAATMVGIDLYDPVVAETRRYRLLRMMYYNFTADEVGRVRCFPQRLEIAPFGYEPYRSYLVEKIRLLGANGESKARSFRLNPITPVSRGYDSPCVGVLARDAGFTQAITLSINVKGKNDAGDELATKIGLDVATVEHVLGRDVPTLAVKFENELASKIYEFIATPGAGDDVAFLPFEPHLKGRVFLSGAMGDSVWRRNSSLPSGLPVRVVYGKSITEFRLRVGFAFVPVPAIGARFPRPIKRMTRSEEMAGYTLWKPYDRPFPRRVVEEAGIPRDEFAQSKSATSPTPQNRAELFSPAVAQIMQRYEPARQRSDLTSSEFKLKKLPIAPSMLYRSCLRLYRRLLWRLHLRA